VLIEQEGAVVRDSEAISVYLRSECRNRAVNPTRLWADESETLPFRDRTKLHLDDAISGVPAQADAT
jgi:hypothetical protein